MRNKLSICYADVTGALLFSLGYVNTLTPFSISTMSFILLFLLLSTSSPLCFPTDKWIILNVLLFPNHLVYPLCQIQSYQILLQMLLVIY